MEDQMLIQWQRQPMIIETPFRAAIAGAMRRKMDHMSMLALASRMYMHHLQGMGSGRDGVQRYLDLCYTIDHHKINAIGRQAQTDGSNQLMTFLAFLIGGKGEPTQVELAWVTKLSEQLSMSEGEVTWFYPKVENLRAAYIASLNLRDYLGMLVAPPPEVLIRIESLLGGRSLRHIVDDIARELLGLRKYGVKSCYFQDGLHHPADSAWVFQNPLDLRNVGVATMYQRPLALVSLGEERYIKSLRIRGEQVRVGKSVLTHVDFGFAPSQIFTIDHVGEFHNSHITGVSPLRDAFTRAGHEVTYEFFRAIHILRLYDLLVPIQRVRQMPALPVLKKQGLVAALVRLRRAKPDLRPELFVPRLRLLDNPEQLLREIEAEAERDDEATRRRTGTLKHEVEGFVRALPTGHKASPRARQLAWEEQNIMLAAEDETYVSRHERGDLEVPRKGPKAMRRH